jgi:hypothetical protein
MRVLLALLMIAGVCLVVLSAAELIVVASGADDQYPYGVNDNWLYVSRSCYVLSNCIELIIGVFALIGLFLRRRYPSLFRVGAISLVVCIASYIIIQYI